MSITLTKKQVQILETIVSNTCCGTNCPKEGSSCCPLVEDCRKSREKHGKDNCEIMLHVLNPEVY